MIYDPRKVSTQKEQLDYYNNHGVSGFLRQIQGVKNIEWEQRVNEIAPLRELIFYLDEVLQEIVLRSSLYGWKASAPIFGRDSSTLILTKNATTVAIDWQEIGFGELRCSRNIRSMKTTQIRYGRNYFYSRWVFEDPIEDEKNFGETELHLSTDFGMSALGYVISLNYSQESGIHEPILTQGLTPTDVVCTLQQNVEEGYSYDKAIEQAFSFLEASLYLGDMPDNPEFVRPL